MTRAAALAMGLGVALAACGGGGSSIDAAAHPADAAATADAPPSTPDAMPPDAAPDARPSTVQVLGACTGQTPALTVTIGVGPKYVLTYAQSGATSIKAGDVVEFVTQQFHDATSGAPAGTPDGQFHVDFNQDKCLKFTQAGTFPFYCSFHLFTSSITVQ